MQPRRWSSLIPQLPVWSHTLTQGRTGCWLSPHFTKTILQAGVTKRSVTPFFHLTAAYRQKRSPRHSKPRIRVPDDSHPSSLINWFQMGSSEPEGHLCHPPLLVTLGKASHCVLPKLFVVIWRLPQGKRYDLGMRASTALPEGVDCTWEQSMENPSPEDIVKSSGDFPGDPVVRTACFHFRRCRFNPWSRNLGSHMLHGATQNK